VVGAALFNQCRAYAFVDPEAMRKSKPMSAQSSCRSQLTRTFERRVSQYPTPDEVGMHLPGLFCEHVAELHLVKAAKHEQEEAEIQNSRMEKQLLYSSI
jgi:hypothetical protein